MTLARVHRFISTGPEIDVPRHADHPVMYRSPKLMYPAMPTIQYTSAAAHMARSVTWFMRLRLAVCMFCGRRTIQGDKVVRAAAHTTRSVTSFVRFRLAACSALGQHTRTKVCGLSGLSSSTKQERSS